MDICRNPMVAHRMLGVSTKFPSGHSNTIGAGNLTSESWVPNFFKLPSRNSCSDGFAPWKLRFRFKWVAWGYAKQLPLRYHWRACRSRLKSWIYYMICWNTSRDETLFLLKKCHWALDQLPRPSFFFETCRLIYLCPQIFTFLVCYGTPMFSTMKSLGHVPKSAPAQAAMGLGLSIAGAPVAVTVAAVAPLRSASCAGGSDHFWSQPASCDDQPEGLTWGIARIPCVRQSIWFHMYMIYYIYNINKIIYIYIYML